MALKNHQAETTRRVPLGLSAYSEKELLDLRAQIDEYLQIGHIGTLDIGQEIMIQLRQLKALQNEAINDDETPVNQKAQAANSVTALIKELVKSRAKLYDAERSKQIEDMTIEAMKDAPEEAKVQFFERLEKLLATMPTMTSLMEETAE